MYALSVSQAHSPLGLAEALAIVRALPVSSSDIGSPASQTSLDSLTCNLTNNMS